MKFSTTKANSFKVYTELPISSKPLVFLMNGFLVCLINFLKKINDFREISPNSRLPPRILSLTRGWLGLDLAIGLVVTGDKRVGLGVM